MDRSLRPRELSPDRSLWTWAQVTFKPAWTLIFDSNFFAQLIFLLLSLNVFDQVANFY